MDYAKLSDLVDIHSPEGVLKEVQEILHLISPEFDLVPVNSAFNTVVSLFRGEHPGYQACNTLYHDLRHTTDAFLAMSRLIHGAMLNGNHFSELNIITGLVASLFHDVGYILEEHDTEGTGAKYTADHEQISAEFFERHGLENGLPEEEILGGKIMILCTDLKTDIATIDFPGADVELLGRMINAADLLGQMADRTYLEKLLFLYHEFKEGQVGDYEGEVDILRKTPGFYNFIQDRMEKVSALLDRFMVSHFTARWMLGTNLYTEAIQRQLEFLKNILALSNSDPRDHLKRDDIVRKVRVMYGEHD
ncbi:MAG: hypothetical protein JRJ82_20195 [Deltaproteobacteria bacterium]|nr:hypothetical protein [Deltaproteobacteria bacterium]